MKKLTLGFCFLMLVLTGYAWCMPPTEVQYKNHELSRLGMPGEAPNSYETWQKLIELACEYDDDQIAEKLLTIKSWPTDGFLSTNYNELVASFLTKNPRLFFKHALKGIGSVEVIADMLINEAQEEMYPELEKALKNVPKDKQSPYQQAFLHAAKNKHENLFSTTQSTNKAGEN